MDKRDKKGFILKRSIRFRYTFIVLIMLLASTGISVLLNVYFLEHYYQNQKKNTAIAEIAKINQIMDKYGFNGSYEDLSQPLTEEIEAVMKECWNTYNMSFCVLGADNRILFTTSNNVDNLAQRLRQLLFDKQMDTKTLYENNRYQIVLVSNSKDVSSFLDAYGFLTSDCTFLLSMPVESIRESAAISNRFFVLISIFVALVIGIMTFFMMKRLTQPVKELSAIASRMARLDFQAVYKGKEADEIGELGASMNYMSRELKHAIDELQEANLKLQKDIDEKIQIDEMRKEFLSNVSHELKTPIAIIQGYAEGLQDCVNEDEESRSFYCDVIMDEASKMNTMVQKLIRLNQLEFSTSILDQTEFELNELIDNMVQSTQVLISQKEAFMEYSPCRPSLMVRGDAFLIEEVVKNFISNACNHVRNQGRIEISTELVSPDRVRVNVYNDGEPIPEASLPLVWDKFYKVDKARTRAYGGSGIGLSIVKAIMEQHNNQYGVYNLDQGVNFWFEINLVSSFD